MPETSSGGSATRAIVLLATVSFAAQAMVRVTDSLLPQIAVDLNSTVGATSIIVTLYLLAHGSVQLVAGPVGDRVGKYRWVAISATVSTVMVALCGLAVTLPQLVAARIGSGLATGCIIPLALAYVGDVIPYERRQQVIGSFLSGQILGQLFGQAAGGVLGDHFGWRNVFFMLAAMLAIATVGLYVEMWRNPVTRAGHTPNAPNQGIVAGYASVLRSPWARAVIVMGFVEFGAMYGAFTYVGADLRLRFGLSFTLVGLFVGAFAIGGLLYSLSVRTLVSRLGQIRLAAGGGMVMGAAFVVLAFMPTPWIAPLSIVAIGFGFYMLHNTLQTNATQMTPEARGTALGAFSSSLYLGQTTGVAVAAVVFDHAGAVPVFVATAIILLALGLWCASAIRRRQAEPA